MKELQCAVCQQDRIHKIGGMTCCSPAVGYTRLSENWKEGADRKGSAARRSHTIPDGRGYLALRPGQQCRQLASQPAAKTLASRS